MAADENDAEDTRPTKRSRTALSDASSFAAPPVTVIVGADLEDGPKTFYVPEKILTSQSEFFAAALRNAWNESKERVVRLPEDKPDTFACFLNFVTSGDLGPWGEHEGELLSYCWALGGKLLCTDFQDFVADAMASDLYHLPAAPTDWYETAYELTSTPNSLSRLVVDIAVWGWDGAMVKNVSLDTPGNSRFLQDLAARSLEVDSNMRAAPGPFFSWDCTYHEHVKQGSRCYREEHKYWASSRNTDAQEPKQGT